jgi:hypothetical protein
VCNGVELSSGAIRNHRPEIMIKAFEIAGYDRETIETNSPPYGKPSTTAPLLTEASHPVSTAS